MNRENLALALGKVAPKLTGEDILSINQTFPSYLFRRRKTREVWTTCCLRHEYLPKRGMTQEQEALMKADHHAEPRGYQCCHIGVWSAPAPKKPANPTTAKCPWCGRVGNVKELGRSGRRDNLAAYRRAVVFKWHGEALWAVACLTSKRYGGDEFKLIEQPDVTPIAVYRFLPGRAERAECRYYGRASERWKAYVRFEECQLKSRGTFSESFPWSADMGMSYDTVNMGALVKSHFRWCGTEEFAKHSNDVMRFLALCTVYPRQVEMLVKAGMVRMVRDLVEDGVPHKDVFDWTQTDPRKAFGLDGGELRRFLACGHELSVLTIYKRAKKRGCPSPLEAWAALYRDLLHAGTFRETSAKLYNNGLTVEKWRSYIERERAKANGKKKSMASFNTVAIWWKDYLNAAVVLGYDLKNPIFLMPKGLSKKHDEATKAALPILEAMRDKKNGEKAARRLRTLAKQYTYSDGRFLIRPPLGAAEIVAEGKALRHCVGGYADRHINGTCTILFLRDRTEPGKPLVTIEMSKARIVQIHGWDDERTACKKNPKRISPRELYAEFLTPWLAWLEGGSKRDKKGNPVIPQNKQKAGAA